MRAERGPVPRNVAGHLQRLILRGGLKPGDRLPSQRELAEQLGVSRPSLREALTVLETMGLIVVQVGSGVFVASPEARAPLWRFSDRCSPRDVYEARYRAGRLRGALSPPATSTRRAPRGSTACVDDMRRALAADDIAAMAPADAVFHDLVFELCANPVLAGMYRPVRDIMVETPAPADDPPHAARRDAARARGARPHDRRARSRRGRGCDEGAYTLGRPALRRGAVRVRPPARGPYGPDRDAL